MAAVPKSTMLAFCFHNKLEFFKFTLSVSLFIIIIRLIKFELGAVPPHHHQASDAVGGSESSRFACKQAARLQDLHSREIVFPPHRIFIIDSFVHCT